MHRCLIVVHRYTGSSHLTPHPHMLPEVPPQSRDQATLAKSLTVKCGRRNRIGVDLIRYYESRYTQLSNAVLLGLRRLIHRAYESAKLHAFLDKKVCCRISCAPVSLLCPCLMSQTRSLAFSISCVGIPVISCNIFSDSSRLSR